LEFSVPHLCQGYVSDVVPCLVECQGTKRIVIRSRTYCLLDRRTILNSGSRFFHGIRQDLCSIISVCNKYIDISVVAFLHLSSDFLCNWVSRVNCTPGNNHALG